MSTQQFPAPFGPYVLERFIAQGGMAEVFLARRRDGAIEGPLCVKRMLPDMMKTAEYVTMFRDEARLSQRLVHPNVVRVYDSGDADGRLYMAMEYVDGMDVGSLQKKLRQRGEMLGVGHALRIAIGICRGLAYAHALTDDAGQPLRLIHRDISPQNILLSSRGDVKVSDFGIAKATGRETRTQTGLIKGKVPYMSPEQALGQDIDQRLDQFAAGIVIWEMLTGLRLYNEKSELLTFEKIIRHPPPKPSASRTGIPGVVDGIVTRALAKNPEARFPDLASFAGALEQALSHMDVPSDLGPVMHHVLGGREGSLARAVATSAPPPALTSAASPKSRGLVVAKAGAPEPRPEARALSLDEAPTVLTPGSKAALPHASSSASSHASSSAPPHASSNAPSSTSAPQRTPSAPSKIVAEVDDVRDTIAVDHTFDRAPDVAPPAPAFTTSPTTTTATREEPARTFPVAALAGALVLGLGVGFGAAKMTSSSKPSASANADCPMSSPSGAGAAQSALAAAKDAFTAGDLAMAERRASEAEAKSGSSDGEMLLGNIAMKRGDRVSAMAHYRCVVALDPSSDAAQELERKLR